MAYVTLQFPMRQNPPIWMADISVYNSDRRNYPSIEHFDFQQYYDKGGRMIMIRSRTGVAGVDFEFAYNLPAAVAKGLLVQPYLDFKPWKDVRKQADGFLADIEVAKATAGSLFIGASIDNEGNDGLNAGQWVEASEKLINQIRDDYDGYLEMYTSASKCNQFAGKTMSDVMKRLPLHVAHYFTGIDPFRVPSVRPYIPDIWGKINNPKPPAWWQIDTYDLGYLFGSRGENELDMNLLCWNGGTYAAFKELYGVDLPVASTTPPTPDPEPEPEPTFEYAQILVDQISVRYDPVFQNVSDPNGNLFAKGMKGRKVKIASPGDVVSGYRPVVAWVWNNSIKPLS